MRFGHWRGLTLTVALLLSITAGRTARADGFSHTLPKEVLARDLNTGGPYMAPPIPWGHYAKSGLTDHFFPKGGLLGKLHSGCLFCGKGPGGKCGHGLFNRCGDPGCGDPGCGGHAWGHGKRVKDCGLCKGKGCGLCNSSDVGDPIHVMSSSQSPCPPPMVTPAPQASPQASSQCGDPGCRLGKGHHHGDDGAWGDPCGSCGGRGCGKCGGLGRLFGKLCGGCGGKGCGLCGMGGGLKGKLAGLLHHNKVKYFVGPGGPVPLTPGYTPYVITTRSPRDFLAFPPYTPDGF